MAGELRRLADDLTRHRAALPSTVAEFTARLEVAYRRKAGVPMEMEAQLVHEAWRAMVGESGGAVDGVTRYHLQLALLADAAQAPLVAVGLDGLSGAESEFLAAYAQRQPVLVISTGAAATDRRTRLAGARGRVARACRRWTEPARARQRVRARS